MKSCIVIAFVVFSIRANEPIFDIRQFDEEIGRCEEWKKNSKMFIILGAGLIVGGSIVRATALDLGGNSFSGNEESQSRFATGNGLLMIGIPVFMSGSVFFTIYNHKQKRLLIEKTHVQFRNGINSTKQ